MLEQISWSFDEIGIPNVLERCRDVFINEYLDSKTTTVKLCGITLQEPSAVESLLQRLNHYFVSYNVRLYHHTNIDKKYGGLVIRVQNFLLSEPELLKVNENIQIH